MKSWKSIPFKSPLKKPAFPRLLFLALLLGSSFFVFADRYGNLELFAKVLNLVERNYFKPLSASALIHSAIRGLLREIDPHSYFFTPKNFTRFKEKTKGNRYGIGLEIERRGGGLMIFSVVPGSPAARAGLKKGDRLMGVDEQPVKHLTVDEFFQKFTGTKHYTVSVSRGGRGKKASLLKVRVRPGRISIPSVRFEKLSGGAVYVRIFQFTKTTLAELRAGFKKRSPAEGVLLDIRGNPGGLFDQAVKTADLFISEGDIVHFRTRSKTQNTSFPALKSGGLPDFPLVVLMDEYSASGSEILAGALKDHGRARLVGRKTFGKGTVQDLFRLKGDYGVKLTVGEYHTPSGAVIEGRGIEPHVLLEKPKDTPPARNTGKKQGPEEDPEIRRALRHLKTLAKASS